ncbi:MAG: hypothetical protein QOJ94_2175, partial [Sphingomonadales bacterium]|nr:hypothetical protein [Sphingomonadales bacterium]
MPYPELLTDHEIESALRAVVAADQFDDWVPDAVHYQDAASRLARPAPLIDRIRRTGGNPSGVDGVPLSRDSSSPLVAATLPLELRIIVYAAAIRIARKIVRHLPRDRVLGFSYRPVRANAGIFSLPEDGIGQLFEARTMPVSFLFRGHEMIVLDVQGAWARSSWSKLREVLLDASADMQDVDMVGRAYGRFAGLPTADDAWAFLANYIFAPVDIRLRQAGIDFYRVRDEYVVFEDRGRIAVRNALAQAGYSSLQISGMNRFGDVEAELRNLCPPPGDGDVSPVGFSIEETPGFDVMAEFDCMSDFSELQVKRHAPFSADKAVKLFLDRASTSSDAI